MMIKKVLMWPLRMLGDLFFILAMVILITHEEREIEKDEKLAHMDREARRR